MTFDLRSSAPGEYDAPVIVAATISFNTPTVDLGAIDAGTVVQRVWVEVLTGFNAGTTNDIVVGDGTTANRYIVTADVTEATPGVYPTGGKGPYPAETAARTLRATYTQSGTPATAGSARVYAEYSRPR